MMSSGPRNGPPSRYLKPPLIWLKRARSIPLTKVTLVTGCTIKSVVFVDDDVVGTPERTAFQILEAAAHLVEASQIDPADEGYAGNRMHDHAQGQRHVGLLLNRIDQLFGNGSAAEGQHGSLGRPHDDIGAD